MHFTQVNDIDAVYQCCRSLPWMSVWIKQLPFPLPILQTIAILLDLKKPSFIDLLGFDFQTIYNHYHAESTSSKV